MEKALNILIMRNIDCSKTYELAAEDAENENLRNFLKVYAARRGAYAIEIGRALNKAHIKTDPPISLLGSALRQYMRLRSSLNGWKDQAILKACSRNESRALASYEKTIEQCDLSNDILTIIVRHRDKILDAEQILRGMNSIIERRKFELKRGISHS